MKFNKFIYATMAAALLAACSDKDVVADGPDTGTITVPEGGDGFVAVRINLPTQPVATPRAINDNFDDGTPNEYAVNNGALLLFAGANEKDAVFKAAYNLMFNRLMYNDDASRAALLQIRNLNTGKVVACLNLPYMLAEGRAAYELYGYSPQEYLDREYDYHLNLFLKGDSWAYCDIVVNLLSWSKRHQNEEL